MRCAALSAALLAALVAALVAPVADARVVRIVIDETVALPAGAGPACGQIAGRALGELDPALAGNAIIQDIGLAKDSDGKVRYVATFVLTKPVDLKQASGLMWHDVPNRGRNFPMATAEREVAGDTRASLEERHGHHDGHVRAVRHAVARAMDAGFLLEPDAAALIRAAEASAVLR